MMTARRTRDRPGLTMAKTRRDEPRKPADVSPSGDPGTESPALHPAVMLVQAWLAGDEDEQRHTLRVLKHNLDEDRLSQRRRFEE